MSVAKLSKIPAAFASETWQRLLEANASVSIRAAIHEIQPSQAVATPVLEISNVQAFFNATVDGIEHGNAAAVPLVVNEGAAVPGQSVTKTYCGKVVGTYVSLVEV